LYLLGNDANYNLGKINCYKVLDMNHFYARIPQYRFLPLFDCLVSESDIFSESKLLSNSLYYTGHSYDTIVMPYTFRKRFARKNPFEKRKNKAVATGTYEVLHDIRYRELRSAYHINCLHPMRRDIYCHKEEWAEYIDSKISRWPDDELKGESKHIPKHLTQKKYYSFDMVDLYNQYKMAIIGEEIVGSPAVGFVEAMACGCAVIVPKNGGTDEFGIDNHNCLVVDTESKEKCEEALIKLVENCELRNHLAVNAIKEICSFYPEKSAYLFLNAVFGDDSKAELLKKKELPKNIFPSYLKELISKCDEIYIYGAGYFAKVYASFLIEENVEFKAFVVSSKKDNPDILLNHGVLTLPELNLMKKNRNKIGFIVAMLKESGLEVAAALAQMGYTNIFIHGHQNGQ